MDYKAKILAEIERLKRKSLEYGYNKMQVILADTGKDLTLDNLLAFINSLPEEPVPTPHKEMDYERWKKACEAASCDANYRSHFGLTEARDDYFVDGEQWADEHPIKEPVSEDLEEAAWLYADKKAYLDNAVFTPNALEKERTRLSFDWYSLRETFKAGAQWQADQGITKEAVIGMATEEIAINVSQSTLDALDLCAGDKVIIQIKKKEN